MVVLQDCVSWKVAVVQTSFQLLEVVFIDQTNKKPKKQTSGWRDGPAVKSKYHSCRGHKFDSQNPYQTYNSTFGDLIPSSRLQGNLHTLMYKYPPNHTYPHIIKLKKILKKTKEWTSKIKEDRILSNSLQDIIQYQILTDSVSGKGL